MILRGLLFAERNTVLGCACVIQQLILWSPELLEVKAEDVDGPTRNFAQNTESS